MMMGKLQAEAVQIAQLYSKTQKSYPIVSKSLRRTDEITIPVTKGAGSLTAVFMEGVIQMSI
jgi:hypothetical protein